MRHQTRVRCWAAIGVTEKNLAVFSKSCWVLRSEVMSFMKLLSLLKRTSRITNRACRSGVWLLAGRTAWSVLWVSHFISRCLHSPLSETSTKAFLSSRPLCIFSPITISQRDTAMLSTVGAHRYCNKPGNIIWTSLSTARQPDPLLYYLPAYWLLIMLWHLVLCQMAWIIWILQYK